MMHTLLGGPSGIGKTHLAKCVAKEMGADIVDFYASAEINRVELCRCMGGLKKPGDILFIDEGHALSTGCQEILYPAIDRRQIPAIQEEKQKRRLSPDEWVEIPAFTLIVATDQHGRLCNALNQRLELKLMLSWYSDEEMRQVVFNRAAELDIVLTGQACTRLAQAARGTPRRARHLLQSVQCLARKEDMPLSCSAVNKMLRETLGLDQNNLTAQDHRYIEILHQRRAPVALGNLALCLGLDTAAVIRDTESYLLRRGWLGIGTRGRFLTETGQALVNEGACA